MGKFTIQAVKTGFTFHLKAGNGETIATSQVYESTDGAHQGIASIKKNCLIANLEDQTIEGFAAEKHPKFEVFNDAAGEFRFHLKATNGQIIAASQGYTAKESCINGIESVKKNAPDAEVIVVE